MLASQFHALNINEWKRKAHFHFFKQFEEPFFGVCIDIDCSKAVEFAKQEETSFFLYYLYHSLKAANQCEPFRYRIVEKEQVIVYDHINASPTINREDGTFGFSVLPYRESFEQFVETALPIVEEVRNAEGLEPANDGSNMIHYSSLPWLKFTSLSHARSFSFPDSIPKISFGKATEENGVWKMPVSIHAHHALMDGKDVADYVDLFQSLMNS